MATLRPTRPWLVTLVLGGLCFPPALAETRPAGPAPQVLAQASASFYPAA